jgi:hypothetical protein
VKTSLTIYLACGLAVLGVCAGAQTPKTLVPAAEARPAPRGAFAKEIGDLEACFGDGVGVIFKCVRYARISHPE